MLLQKQLLMRYLMLSLFLFVGCTPCDDVNCINGSKSENGTDCKCSCYEGYEGGNCQKLQMRELLGTYQTQPECTSIATTSRVQVQHVANNTADIQLWGLTLTGTYKPDREAIQLLRQTWEGEGNYDEVKGRFAKPGNARLRLVFYREDALVDTCFVRGR